MHNSPQHLIFDLRQITGVEKIIGTEKLIPYRVRVRIKTAMLAKVFLLGLLFTEIIHRCLLW
jgi:hypothetical protein